MEYFGGNIEDKNAVIRQFGEYKTHKDDFSLVNAYACEEDPTGFWEMMQDAKPQLAAVALRLFGMSVHAGSVERLWSALGLIQTKSCNRLDSAKAVKIAQIQAVMRSRVAIQEVTAQAKPRGTNASQRQFQRLYLPTASGATSSLSIPTPHASQ
ncbi:hypothetical protein MPTK1_3g20670 [Marchantia polymorpha subsp. ruderalis]|uniref:HAT C-terminal dimerisation domain-containing protein n=2 Tax=Marchantia polymorpha TaxID=3197 RepID=A0AAF6B301_MARPO|nr:hypothetical protein MARPO_0149s0033 [Marchantia polymorpha]BBN06385.1 hypothetical protein Mp_3g20670 [Marchantia polymorpha subsp. ruderalis]|eukprot:PTQ29041.1 hypothetical protein MARPO_0149s0033 [Marchantia polymorpha]